MAKNQVLLPMPWDDTRDPREGREGRKGLNRERLYPWGWPHKWQLWDALLLLLLFKPKSALKLCWELQVEKIQTELCLGGGYLERAEQPVVFRGGGQAAWSQMPGWGGKGLGESVNGRTQGRCAHYLRIPRSIWRKRILYKRGLVNKLQAWVIQKSLEFAY